MLDRLKQAGRAAAQRFMSDFAPNIGKQPSVELQKMHR